MGRKYTITIQVEAGSQEAKLTDDRGQEWSLDGLVLFGCSERRPGNLVTFAWGSPKDAAFAAGEGLSLAAGAGDPFYLDFYRCLLYQMACRTGTGSSRPIDPEQLLRRWEEEDEETGAETVVH